MSIKQEYIKNRNQEIISPIVSADSVYMGGNSLTHHIFNRFKLSRMLEGDLESNSTFTSVYTYSVQKDGRYYINISVMFNFQAFGDDISRHCGCRIMLNTDEIAGYCGSMGTPYIPRGFCSSIVDLKTTDTIRFDIIQGCSTTKPYIAKINIYEI